MLERLLILPWCGTVSLFAAFCVSGQCHCSFLRRFSVPREMGLDPSVVSTE